MNHTPEFSIKRVRTLKYLKALERNRRQSLISPVVAMQEFKILHNGPTGAYSYRHFQFGLGHLAAASLVMVLLIALTFPQFQPMALGFSANAKVSVTILVNNNNGGSATDANFSSVINGTAATPGSLSGNGTFTIDASAAYGVVASGPDGYDISYSAGCNGTLADGASTNCTVTANDNSATLRVVKHVVGGPKKASDFTLHISGTKVSSATFSGDESGTVVSLDPGLFSVTEDPDPNYGMSSSTKCSAAINLGQRITCIITNTYISPTTTPTTTTGSLIVVNHVMNDNGNSYHAADFTAQVTGTNVSSSTFATLEAPGTTLTLDPGVYSTALAAGFPAGYNSTYSTDCAGTIAAGDIKTCTITTDDQPGTLMIRKVVVNNNGGTKQPSDFTIQVTGVNPSKTSFYGSSSPTIITVDPGRYSVNESTTLGYIKSLGLGCSGNINFGQVIACTITNTDSVPTPPGGGGGGEGSPATFALTLTKSGDGNGTVNVSVNGATSTIACDLTQCDPAKGQVAFTQTYASGTVVTLIPNPNATSNFNGTWSGNCSGVGNCVLTMTGNKTVNAHFGINSIPPTTSGGGSIITGSGGNGNGGGRGGGGGIPMGLLTISKNGLGNGTVTSSDGNINCGQNCAYAFPFGSIVTLTATPNATSSFIGTWSGGGCSGDGLCTVTVNGNVQVNAHFSLAATGGSILGTSTTVSGLTLPLAGTKILPEVLGANIVMLPRTGMPLDADLAIMVTVFSGVLIGLKRKK